MAQQTIAIIGAGIGGLAAGCYAQRNGLKTQIFESHSLPGGLCTSWKRNGYTFDGSVHHLAGCREGGPIYQMWEELGAMPRECVFPDRLTQVESPQGEVFCVFVDIDRLEQHMLESFPQDRREILNYTKAVRAFRKYDLLEVSVRRRIELLRYLPAVPLFARRGFPTMASVGARFKNPFLRQAFPTIQYDWPELPAMLHLNMLAQCSRNNYGFPTGGSLPFAQSIATRYQELGGTITYGSRVTKILTKGNRAAGLRLEDGTEFLVDAVISNASAPSTLYQLLDEQLVDPKTRKRFAVPDDSMVMGLQISLGVARDLSNEPQALVLLQDKPVRIADQTLERVPVELYGFDSTLAPNGKSMIKVALSTSYAHWKVLAEQRSRYEAEKARAAEAVIDVLEKRFEGIREQIEVIDVATPLTTERYTANGMNYGPESGNPPMLAMMLSKPLTLPKLQRLQIVGQSAGGGGLNGCAVMGKKAVHSLCKELGIRFGS